MTTKSHYFSLWKSDKQMLFQKNLAIIFEVYF